ncbi:MAG TPA: KH domain-containing protein [Candidatus Olsenella pullistercoris]|uniref:KH domain-containing protein n=1 Tax=Candidatus Olsenella pullistercoris TaxID=2838712 RepID=A0A9D2F0B0_9ACTN|nr:KH domain-containing protein [Candidatus Olsenella pullistercoris]
MSEEVTMETEENLVPEAAAQDDFASVREHYETTGELTEEETDRIADVAVGYLKGILALFGETNSSIDEYDGENGELILDVIGGDLAVLIGRHGRTLDALQMVLTSLMSSRIKFYYPIVVDIESYKSRRKKKLVDMARSSAARAKERGGKVTLSPMNAYERRIIHLALVNDESVVTHSEGEEPERRVVITAVR